MFEVGRVCVSLCILGNFDPFEIAEILEGEGARGMKADPRGCVLANYLKRESGLERIRVGFSRSGVSTEFIEHPESVRQFVALFDWGRFPMLETDESRERPPIIFVTVQMKKYLGPWITGEAPIMARPSATSVAPVESCDRQLVSF